MTFSKKYNKAIIITAPSGSGKTTITNSVLSQLDSLSYSVSATTRKPREGEIDGIDYYYIEPKDFVKKIEQKEFIEWEEVYKDMYYGTLKSEVERIWNLGKAVIFVVDVIGALQLKKYFEDKALSIFIQPPSLKVLEQRLILRGSETEDTLHKRKERFSKEMSYLGEFDKVIINENLVKACNEALSLINDFLEK
jgi:guanylate kinase